MDELLEGMNNICELKRLVNESLFLVVETSQKLCLQDNGKVLTEFNERFKSIEEEIKFRTDKIESKYKEQADTILNSLNEIKKLQKEMIQNTRR